jgi:DNA-binding XRE family transcriptional regulator
MPKVRAFDLSPLPVDAQASLEALGQKIAATRKAQGLSQKDMAANIGISPQTMLFIEQGRPNVQIGHYARALSTLAAGVLSSQTPSFATQYAKQPVATYTTTSSNTSRINALRRHLTHHSRQPSPTQDLEFAYDWSNSGMTEDALIRKVVDKGRFHDLAVICKRYGLERVRQIAGEKMKSSPSLRRSLHNIEEGFAHERQHSA